MLWNNGLTGRNFLLLKSSLFLPSGQNDTEGARRQIPCELWGTQRDAEVWLGPGNRHVTAHRKSAFGVPGWVSPGPTCSLGDGAQILWGLISLTLVNLRKPAPLPGYVTGRSAGRPCGGIFATCGGLDFVGFPLRQGCNTVHYRGADWLRPRL
jgi:hypothetical protein